MKQKYFSFCHLKIIVTPHALCAHKDNLLHGPLGNDISWIFSNFFLHEESILILVIDPCFLIPDFSHLFGGKSQLLRVKIYFKGYIDDMPAKPPNSNFTENEILAPKDR